MARRQEVIAEHQHGMLLWQAEMRTRLRRTQGLVARTYEAIHDWPRQLAAAREHPEYERSYSEPEPLISVVMSTYHSPDTLVDVALASAPRHTGTGRRSSWATIARMTPPAAWRRSVTLGSGFTTCRTGERLARPVRTLGRQGQRAAQRRDGSGQRKLDRTAQP
jgi:hypothetical protein